MVTILRRTCLRQRPFRIRQGESPKWKRHSFGRETGHFWAHWGGDKLGNPMKVNIFVQNFMATLKYYDLWWIFLFFEGCEQIPAIYNLFHEFLYGYLVYWLIALFIS